MTHTQSKWCDTWQHAKLDTCIECVTQIHGNMCHVVIVTTHYTGTTHVRQKNTTHKCERSSWFFYEHMYLYQTKTTQKTCVRSKNSRWLQKCGTCLGQCQESGQKSKLDRHQKSRAMLKMTPYECRYCMECHWDMCHDTTAQANAVKNTSHVFQTT